MRAERFHVPAAPLALVAAALLTAAGPATAQEAPAAPAPPPTADRVYTGDHVVEAGEVVEDVAVVGGDLTVRGEVTGNAVVVGGNLILAEGGRVGGDATVTGGRIVHQGGRVRGEMRTLDAAGDDLGEEIEAGVRAGLDEAEIERRIEADVERRIDRAMSRLEDRNRWFDPIREGFAGLISALAFGLVLAGIGAALVFYGRPYLETVSDTVRNVTLRSAGVGLAATFLIVPAFVVMVVALAVSIVGIPVLLVAIPLYPLAIIAAIVLGLLAAAHAIGERTAEQQAGPFDRRWSNSYAYLFAGVGMLVAPLLAANLIEMTGFLDFLGAILEILTWAAIWVVAMTGFGAVILSRGGTRRTFAAPPADPTFDPDPLFDDEPTPGSTHV